jgi:hypothetical protein
LDGGRADRTGRPVDEQTYAGSHLGGPQIREREEGAVAHRRAVVEPDAVGEHGHGPLGANAHVLGVRAEPVGVHPEDSVADREAADTGTDRVDDPRELAAQDPLSGSNQAAEGPNHEWFGAQETDIGAVDGAGLDSHPQLSGTGGWDGNVAHGENVGSPVPVVDRRPHRRARWCRRRGDRGDAEHGVVGGDAGEVR